MRETGTSSKYFLSVFSERKYTNWDRWVGSVVWQPGMNSNSWGCTGGLEGVCTVSCYLAATDKNGCLPLKEIDKKHFHPCCTRVHLEIKVHLKNFMRFCGISYYIQQYILIPYYHTLYSAQFLTNINIERNRITSFGQEETSCYASSRLWLHRGNKKLLVQCFFFFPLVFKSVHLSLLSCSPSPINYQWLCNSFLLSNHTLCPHASSWALWAALQPFCDTLFFSLQHTAVLPLALLEILATPHRYPAKKKGLFLLGCASFLYVSW